MILAVDLCDVTAAVYIPAKRLPPVKPWPGQGSLPVSLRGSPYRKCHRTTTGG